MSKGVIYVRAEGYQTGIEGIRADGSHVPVYDLRGHRVDGSAKGLYIQGGKKKVKK